MALPAFLMPALAGFAISKLGGASTKTALKNALFTGATAGITSGMQAAEAAKAAGTATSIGQGIGSDALAAQAAQAGAANLAAPSAVQTGLSSLKESMGTELFKLGKTPVTTGSILKYGVPAAMIYKSFADAANAPKETMFYGANINYADPRIYANVGPTSFKVGEYDSSGQMTGTTGIEGAEDYVPPEAYYRSGEVPAMPYAVGKQLITAKEGGLATLKGIRKYNAGGQVLPSKMNYDENDANNYVRANGHIVDMSSMADKDEDTVLAQLADGEFVTRADGVLGAGILAGASPGNMKEMRKQGAKYFYEQQAKFKRIFDLLNENRNKSSKLS